MPFSDWDSYQDLLRGLHAAASQWGGAKDFAQFDENVRRDCADLVGGEYGYDGLCKRLEESGDYGGGKDQLFAHLRIVALAAPAAEFGLGPEWKGYWISKNLDGGEVYSDNRYAAPSAWPPAEIPVQAAALTYDEETGLMYDAANWYLRDGKTIVWPDEQNPAAFRDGAGNTYLHGELQAQAKADPAAQQFDKETGRWRRRNEPDGEFEYYHSNDGVWERSRQNLWHRYHQDAAQWLPYDEPSQTWLYQGEWHSYDDVTTLARPGPASPVPVSPAEPVSPAGPAAGDAGPAGEPGPAASDARPAGESSPAAGDQAPDEEEEDEDEQILTAMADSVDAAITKIRDLGVSEDEVSDEDIIAMFEQRAEEMLSSELPELGQLLSKD
jgi:hypothetical protein